MELKFKELMLAQEALMKEMEYSVLGVQRFLWNFKNIPKISEKFKMIQKVSKSQLDTLT